MFFYFSFPLFQILTSTYLKFFFTKIICSIIFFSFLYKTQFPLFYTFHILLHFRRVLGLKEGGFACPFLFFYSEWFQGLPDKRNEGMLLDSIDDRWGAVLARLRPPDDNDNILLSVHFASWRSSSCPPLVYTLNGSKENRVDLMNHSVFGAY
jgi:hypothetical protein